MEAEGWFNSLLGCTHDTDTAVVDWILDVVSTDFERCDELEVKL